MKIRALKTTTGLPRGSVSDVEDSVGRELIALGYAIEVLPLDKQEAAPANDNIPFPLDQTGSLTGADAPLSLSRADQAQKTLTCPPSGDDAMEPEGKSESSPSTTDTNSARGQMSSTPATTNGGKRKRGRPRSGA